MCRYDPSAPGTSIFSTIKNCFFQYYSDRNLSSKENCAHQKTFLKAMAELSVNVLTVEGGIRVIDTAVKSGELVK